MAQFAQEFGLPDPKVGPRTRDIVEVADCNFKAARLCVTITAAANAAIALIGEEQRVEARKLVDTKSPLTPKALLDVLQAIASDIVVATNGVKRSADEASMKTT